MDLLGAGSGQSQQHPAPASTQSGSSIEKPFDAMSRPSLISSLWSIQVQNEGSASDYPMAGCGSQQSLPEMLNQTHQTFHHCNGFSPGADGGMASIGQQGDQLQQGDLASSAMMPMDQSTASAANQIAGTSLRPVKSLSDLHTLTAAQIAQTAAVMPCSHHHNVATPGQNDQSYLGFRRQTETGTYYTMLSRQQRDSQICEWLQKLNVSGGGVAENSGSESPSQEFYLPQQQQQRPSFQRADTTEQ